ncbi:CPCC family cysteine-rich protein [Paenibacillus helianthi]|uniref:CPCC family cysteine-rich protein n=1 Tax=Paenibacillus helianthi TaxID=1349432 RepID=UPI001FC99F95|nr:CPCC family cysteine-rich protein [Paenibacillus helianthi]
MYGVQLDEPDYAGGANAVSLGKGQSNFLRFRFCEERCMLFVRKPNENDIFEGPKIN